jgi:protein gp37
MGKDSKILWTNHTFNPWIGCTKVSPGCLNCYAERQFSHRHHRADWGRGNPRVRTSAGNWAQPLAWDRAAAKSGEQTLVFCASLADVFDHEVPSQWKEDLWKLIEATPHLTWQLLTKRPEWFWLWPVDDLRQSNVWIGTTVEDQQRADERIPHLLKIPARLHFVSCEPLVGPVDLNLGSIPRSAIDWIIAGGESGPKARPMDGAWATSLRDQAKTFGVPFMFKQWGGSITHRLLEGREWSEKPGVANITVSGAGPCASTAKKTADPASGSVGG